MLIELKRNLVTIFAATEHSGNKVPQTHTTTNHQVLLNYFSCWAHDTYLLWWAWENTSNMLSCCEITNYLLGHIYKFLHRL